MDLDTVDTVRTPRTRAELWPLGPTDALLAGGTWLFSEPQPHLRRLVDLGAMGWPPITLHDNGIELSATCPLIRVSELSRRLTAGRPEWRAAPLFHQCCTALLASWKIWRTATVGGNLGLSFAAGSMISLASALSGVVEVWRPGGDDYRIAVDDFVTGAGTNALAADEVIRSVTLPARALRATTAYQKLAPARWGRSGVVVIGRRDADADGGGFVLSITAATTRPFAFAFPSAPTADELADAHAAIPDDAWVDDAHGDPDWRRAMALVLAERVRRELT